ncbi:hypothetical protein ACU4GD_45895 [Cupriavidus basilensis]
MVDAARRARYAASPPPCPYFRLCPPGPPPAARRVAISAEVVAKACWRSPASTRVLTMDLHADQIQGFFDIPVDNIYAAPVLLGDLREKATTAICWSVSPDVGGVVRARCAGQAARTRDLAIIDKRRPKANVAEVMNIIGEVDGRNCVIMDDMDRHRRQRCARPPRC